MQVGDPVGQLDQPHGAGMLPLPRFTTVNNALLQTLLSAEEIEALARYFVKEAGRANLREIRGIDAGAVRLLVRHDWPGNVRELKNVIERAVILSTGQVLRLDLSMPGVAPDAVDQAPGETHPEEVLTEKDMRELQKANIIRALNQANWKVSGKGGAAELLGVKPTTLADRIRTYKIKRPSR